MTLFAQQKQNPPKSTTWQLWKIFPSATVRQEPDTRSAAFGAIDLPPRAAQRGQPVETQIVSILAREGAMSLREPGAAGGRRALSQRVAPWWRSPGHWFVRSRSFYCDVVQCARKPAYGVHLGNQLNRGRNFFGSGFLDKLNQIT